MEWMRLKDIWSQNFRFWALPKVWVFMEEDLEDESVTLEVTYNFVLATMEWEMHKVSLC